MSNNFQNLDISRLKFIEVNCDFCGSNQFRLVHFVWFLHRWFRFVRCLTCSLIYQNPQLDEPSRRHIYETIDYWEHKKINSSQHYALDYILGLPRAPVKLPDGSTRPMNPEETLESYRNELMGFTEFVSELKYCYRIAPFMIQYMLGTDLIEHGLAAGDLSNKEIERIKEGFHGNYMAEGSVSIAPKKLRLLQGYRVMLRLMSFLSPRSKKLLLKLKLYKIFWMAPFRLFISVLDLMIAARDTDATTYVKHYWWWFKKRFDKNYHLYMFKKRKKFETLGKCFELPRSGFLGNKTSKGWVRDSLPVELSSEDTVAPKEKLAHYLPELRDFKKEVETISK